MFYILISIRARTEVYW